MKTIFRIVLSSLALVASLYQSHAVAVAQSGTDWSPPVKINVDRMDATGEEVLEPIVIGDEAGVVHVFWRDSASDIIPAIKYAYLANGKWSFPVDILTSPNSANVLRIDIRAADGNAVAAWESRNGIHYSFSRLRNADSAQQWSTVSTQPIGTGATGFGSYMHSEFMEPDGKAVFAYVDHGANDWSVYFGRASDESAVLSEVTKIGDAQSQGGRAYIDNPYLYEQDGVMHAIWSEISAPDSWPPLGIFYSRSTDSGSSWSAPVMIAEGPYETGSLIDANGSLNMIFYGTAENRGRYHTWSPDNGLTWSEPRQILAPLWGLNGRPAVAVDSAGTLHLVTVSDGSVAQQVYYSFWRDGTWAPATAIDESSGNGWASMAVTEGNKLNVVWTRNGDVLYSARRVDAPNVPTVALPTPEPSPTPTPSSSSVLFDDSALIPPSNSEPLSGPQGIATTIRDSSSIGPVIWGLLTSMVFVTAMVFVRLRRHSRIN